MSDLSTMYPVLVRAIAAGFAIGGWWYGHKKGYSLFVKSLLGLASVLLFILIAGIVGAFILPENFPF